MTGIGLSLADVSCVLVLFLSRTLCSRALLKKAMGIDVEMPGGVGILVPHPLKDPADFEARIPTEVDVKDKLSHVIQAVARIKEVNSRPLQSSFENAVSRFQSSVTGHE